MRNLSLGIITTALLALLFSPAVRADLVLSMQPVISAAPGSTGNAFDVLLTNTGASSVDLGAFAYEITTADTDISFTGADTATTAPYVFAGDSFDDINGFTLYTNSLPSQNLQASDLSNSTVGAVIASGATVGVGDILFDVTSGATPGSFAVTFVPFPFTSLADPNGGNLDFTSAAGTIMITGTVPVPEPATGSLLICAFAAAGIIILIRRRRTNPQQA